MISNLKSYIVIGGAEFAVTIDEKRVITAADCPCGETAWTAEHRGFQNEDTFIVCECGQEYPLEHRIAAVDKPLRNISAVYLEVVNLCNAAKDHKRIGCDKDCHTSLYILGQTAKRVMHEAPAYEFDELKALVAETDWL